MKRVALGDPLLGLRIDVDMAQLHDLIGRMGLQAEIGNSGEKGLPRAIGPAVMDEDMENAICRLLRCLQSETESRILGPGLVREILYREFCGTQAPILYSLAMHGGTFSQVARALTTMQSDQIVFEKSAADPRQKFNDAGKHESIHGRC